MVMICKYFFCVNREDFDIAAPEIVDQSKIPCIFKPLQKLKHDRKANVHVFTNLARVLQKSRNAYLPILNKMIYIISKN